jgi:exodeoxyribonuclease VII large subunit
MKNEVPVWTVSETNRRVKQLLEGGFPSVAISGELSNLKMHSSGHMYFTLKDDDAQISGVMWRSRVGNLSFVPTDGMKVVVTGRLTVYEVRGNYQVDIVSMRPMGTGDLQIAFERLKQRLHAEGLFDAARKRSLPPYPERIGIVTSLTGAVMHDILHLLRRRFPAVTVIVNPVRVQGDGAAAEIARALDEFNAYGRVDVIIVARGGGSLEDLWPFNEEIVARALARSLIPVVSAVGHEVDFTIADLVADVRAATPTAAAELVVRDRAALLELVRNSWYSMHERVSSKTRRAGEHVSHLVRSYAFNRPLDLLRRHSQHLDELNRSMQTFTLHTLVLRGTRVKAANDRLRALDPALVLKRGYVIVRKENRIVPSRAQLAANDEISLQFHDGEARSRVE